MYFMHVFAAARYLLGINMFPFMSIFQSSSYSNETSTMVGEVEMCMLKWYLRVSILLYRLPDALPPHTHRHRKVVKADTKQHRYTNVYVVCIDDYGVPLEVLCMERSQIPNCWNEPCAWASSWHSTWNEATDANLIITNNQKMYAVERSQFKHNFW